MHRSLRAALALGLLIGCTPGPRAHEPESVQARDQPAPKPERTPPNRVIDLLQADRTALVAALGNPVLMRRENGGEVWLYAHANGCSIDVVLFMNGGLMTVTHATTQTPAGFTEADCLRAIANIVP